MPLRAVLFDVGETLVHPRRRSRSCSRCLARRGPRLISRGRARRLARRDRRFSEASRDAELWTTIAGAFRALLEERVRADARGARPRPRRASRDALYGAFTDRRNYTLFDDVLVGPGRAGGRRSARSAIVSNFEAWLDDLLGLLGVRDPFPVRVIAGDEGIEKPDPRIFELALERRGLDAADAVYVGDNPEFDIEPAAALGMFPVLIDRRERFPDMDGIADRGPSRAARPGARS